MPDVALGRSDDFGSRGVDQLIMMTWTLRYFDTPTPYYDEPNEFISPGYYVVGHHVEDQLEEARVVFKLEEAVDDAGEDNRAEIAQAVIKILNAAPDLIS